VRRTVFMVSGLLLLTAVLIFGGGVFARYKNIRSQAPAVTVEADAGPFKIKVAPEQPPFSGLGIWSRLPGHHEAEHPVTLSPEPELPNIKNR